MKQTNKKLNIIFSPCCSHLKNLYKASFYKFYSKLRNCASHKMIFNFSFCFSNNFKNKNIKQYYYNYIKSFKYKIYFLSIVSKLSNAFPVPRATQETASSAIITLIPVFSCNNLSSPSIKHPPPVI